jgi:hypothetical protein
MPGPVTKSHADLEENCGECHTPFTKKEQKARCIICHSKVASDLLRKRGFHGRDVRASSVECKFCHSDHLGRDADILGLDRDVFDHRITDYPLDGAHTIVACEGCHENGQKFRDAPGECIDCHRDDDVHRGRLGKDCADCHSTKSWRKEKFDHSTTDFPLEGRHRKIACVQCHANSRYEGIPTDCFSCHKLNDVHAGRFGRKCNDCHQPEAWDRLLFDHDKDTKFELHGKHRTAKCESCHRDNLRKKLPMECADCHSGEDAHRGKNGNVCGDCHTPSGWKEARFDHERKTGFALKGAHGKIDCGVCHRGDLNTELSSKCVACHQGNDIHKGKLGEQCDRCHDPLGWGRRVFFDHDLTRFPLIGIHAATPCEDCHASTAYVGTSLVCGKCHADDDAHEGRFSVNCGLCHNPNNWQLWAFDHNKDTRFPLDGAHSDLGCYDCHAPGSAKRRRTSKSCGSCHGGDDVHRGEFGRACDRCHVTSDFRKVRAR